MRLCVYRYYAHTHKRERERERERDRQTDRQTDRQNISRPRFPHEKNTTEITATLIIFDINGLRRGLQ